MKPAEWPGSTTNRQQILDLLGPEPMNVGVMDRRFQSILTVILISFTLTIQPFVKELIFISSFFFLNIAVIVVLGYECISFTAVNTTKRRLYLYRMRPELRTHPIGVYRHRHVQTVVVPATDLFAVTAR